MSDLKQSLKEILTPIFRETIQEILHSESNTSKSKFLNMVEASEYLRISKNTLYSLTSGKKIRFYKHGSYNLFKKEDLDAYLDNIEVVEKRKT